MQISGREIWSSDYATLIYIFWNTALWDKSSFSLKFLQCVIFSHHVSYE